MKALLLRTTEDRPVLVQPTASWRFPAGRVPAVNLALGCGQIALTTDEAVRLADALTDAAEALDQHKEN